MASPPPAGRVAARSPDRRIGRAQTHRAVVPPSTRTLFSGQACSSPLLRTSNRAWDGELIHRQNRHRAENYWPPSRTIRYSQCGALVSWVPRTASRICNTVSDPPADLHLSEVTSDSFKSSPASAFLVLTAEQRQ